MKKILSIISLAVLTTGFLSSCKKDDSPVSVTGVTLDKASLVMIVGDADVRLTATVNPENATDKTISWSSDKSQVVTVNQDGSLHAVAKGEATITVTTKDGGKTATCAVTVKEIATIADVLATVEGGFPQGTGNMKEPPSNAWVYGSDRYTFVVQSGQNLFLSFYYSEYIEPMSGQVTGNATGVPSTTTVTQGENCYIATFNTITLTFQMTAGKLTSINFSSTNAGMQENYGGTYDTFLVDLKMARAGESESDWNKIAILIKGTDVVSGKYYFNESSDEKFANGVELNDEQIESINKAEGLRIVKEDLEEETTYQTVLVVSNSAGYSKTIVKTYQTGQAPPPM